MNWRSLIPNVPSATRALLITLVVVFLVVEIGTGWLGLPIARFVLLAPGELSLPNLVAWPLHVLYTPADHGFSFILSLFVLAWMLGALEQRFGPSRVFQLTIAVALLSGLAAFVVGAGLHAVAGIPSPMVTGSGPIAMAAAALGAYLVRHQPEVYLFGSVRMTPAQIFGLLVGLGVLNLVISRSLPHFAEHLAALGTGVLFGRWIEGGAGKSSRASRPSATKLRVVKGGDRTLH